MFLRDDDGWRADWLSRSSAYMSPSDSRTVASSSGLAARQVLARRRARRRRDLIGAGKVVLPTAYRSRILVTPLRIEEEELSAHQLGQDVVAEPEQRDISRDHWLPRAFCSASITTG